MTEINKTNVVVEGATHLYNNVAVELQPIIDKTKVLVDKDINVDNKGIREPQTSKTKSSTAPAIPNKALTSMTVFGSTGTLVFFGLLAAFPIAEVIIGRRYKNDCPVKSKIPHYLVVTGIVGLINIILIIIQGIITTTTLKPTLKAAGNDSSAARPNFYSSFILCGILLIIFGLSLFMIGWTIAGLVWVFGVWKQVQYTEPTLSTYCHPTLYKFTYWLFLLPFVVLGVLCLLCCCGAFCGVGVAAASMKGKGLRPVPTTEP